MQKQTMCFEELIVNCQKRTSEVTTQRNNISSKHRLACRKSVFETISADDMNRKIGSK